MFLRSGPDASMIAGAAQVGQNGEDAPVRRGFLFESEISEDGGDMGFDRPLAEVETLGDGPIRESFGDKRQNLPFPR